MTTKTDERLKFTVGQTTLADATVLTPSGALTHETCEAFKAALDTAAAQSRAIVVMDGRQVGVIDSAGLELLVEWHEKFRDAGGMLRLANLNDVLMDIMTATRLIHVLNISRDVGQAAQVG